MTQVLSVSATTAGYASDSIKPPQRASKATMVEENTRLLAEEAAAGDDFQLRALVSVVQPPALALYFLTASQKALGQASLKETIEAYKSSAT